MCSRNIGKKLLSYDFSSLTNESLSDHPTQHSKENGPTSIWGWAELKYSEGGCFCKHILPVVCVYVCVCVCWEGEYNWLGRNSSKGRESENLNFTYFYLEIMPASSNEKFWDLDSENL